MREHSLAGMAEVEAIEAVPLDERVTGDSTYEVIRRGAERHPDRVAIHFFPTGDRYESPLSVTHRELLGRIHQTANLLGELDVGPRDVVSILLPNTLQSHYAIWGAEAAGVANPINPLLEVAQIGDICAAAGTRVLVAPGPEVAPAIWDKAQAVRREVPGISAVLQVGGPGDERDGVLDFDAAIAGVRSDALASGRVFDPGETASLFHTGGTTGTPKLARHTHANEVFLIWALKVVADMTHEDVLLCGLPLFHVNGVFVTGGAPFSTGATVVLLGAAGYRDPGVIRNFYRIVERYGATFFSCVPTVLSALLQVPIEGADLGSLRYAIVGAAPMPPEVFTEFERATGIRILEGYGLTEGACVSSVNPRDGDRVVGSIGIRIPYQDMKVVEVDEAGRRVRDLPPGEIGTLTVRGPNVFPGYVSEAHDRGLWVDDGLNTGDLGRMDDRGYFFLTGRSKDLIIRGGHNIDPGVIEEPLYRRDDVAHAAAVGRPDAHAGEVPVAYVQLVGGAATGEEELVAYCRETITERAAVPKEVRVIETMPLSAVGKIFKPALRHDATRRVYRAALEPLAARVAGLEVEVGEHPRHGTLARIVVRPGEASEEQVEEEVGRLLGRFAVHFDLELEGQ